ncbi:uncharacterized protein LOC118748308, partial [Rhagoletis pomonella]|uniref:uncharacterized protein LOC118748308 n=1 Tax=Rhagoletis pomonella TaxID=28610 RepID=UPI001780701D
MNSFRRAYRDPKSPLTPLTPLASNTEFSFNLGGDDSLKPYIQAIEARRFEVTTKTSPAGLNGGVICVNPRKYTNNVISERTIKTRKLSPRFVSTKKSDIPVKSFGSESDISTTDASLSTNELKPTFSSMTNSSKCHRNSINSNTSAFEESIYDAKSSNYQLSPRNSMRNNTHNKSSRQCSVNDSRASNSDISSDSNISFASNSSATSSSRASGLGNRCRKPPKLVLDDNSCVESDATMSTVFKWMWDNLSPMKNPSIYELLLRVGMQKYWTIFKREEILDLDVFSTLTMDDLKAIGIRDVDDCVKIL